MDSLYLQGSEDVRRAASEMTAAATTMQRAAADFGWQVERLERLWAEVDARIANDLAAGGVSDA